MRHINQDTNKNKFEYQNLPIRQSEDPTSITNSDLIAKPSPTAEDVTTIASNLHPAWNRIDPAFSLFWGDTTSHRFSERLPENAFVLAVPSRQWHHDWLANRSRSCMIIGRPQLDREVLEKFLSAFSCSEKALIFPWLPSWKTVELVLNLNIKVYAGDPDLDRCQQTIAKLGLGKSKIERRRW